MKTPRWLALTWLGLSALPASAAFGAAKTDDAFLGRWDITPTDPKGNYGYWLEVKKEENALHGNYLGRDGSVLPVSRVSIDKGELLMWPKSNEPVDESKPYARAKLVKGKLVGTFTAKDGKVVTWEGARAPAWKAKASANGKLKLGKPVEVFNGKDMSNWAVQYPEKPLGWSVADGAMTNEKNANNIVTTEKWKNFKVVAEYKIDTKSNSGFYLRGRYELQIVDDSGKPAHDHGSTSIYSRVPPTTNAAKPAGEWQTLEATVVENKVTVSLNGQKVHDDVTLDGPTGGAFDMHEGEPGPIMIQGDHGKVWFRKVTVTPVLGF